MSHILSWLYNLDRHSIGPWIWLSSLYALLTTCWLAMASLKRMDGSEWEDNRFPMLTLPLEIFLQMTHVQEYEDLIETLQALRIHFQDNV